MFPTEINRFHLPESRQLTGLIPVHGSLNGNKIIEKDLNCSWVDLFVCLFGFYGISTFVGYLTPNPFFYVNNQFFFKEFSLA